MIDVAVKSEAIRLRVEERLSLREIQKKVQVSKGILSLWLRPFPLSPVEKHERLVRNGKSRGGVSHPAVGEGHTAFAERLKGPEMFPASPSDRNLRSASVGVAVRWFLERGYVPSIPLEQVGYDLVVESPSGLKRVQVKSTTAQDRYGRWVVSVCRRVYDSTVKTNASGKRKRASYAEGVVDVFFVVSGDGGIFVIPREVVGSKVQLTLDRSYAAYKQ